MIPNHANATIGGAGGGGFGVLLTWILNKYLGASIDATEGAAIAAGVATVVLFVGRKGVLGVVHDFLYGSGAKKK